MNVDLLPCCKPRLLATSTASNSVVMLEKILEDSENKEQGQEAME